MEQNKTLIEKDLSWKGKSERNGFESGFKYVQVYTNSYCRAEKVQQSSSDIGTVETE